MPFTPSWTADILAQPPMIAPVRQFTYPLKIAGEEDALARGALLLQVRPRSGGTFLATCALGFTGPSLPTGVFPCPSPDHLCAVAGGYAYLIDTLAPDHCTQIPLKPVVAVHPLAAPPLLLFTGFHSLAAWGEHGLAWQTAKLSWEGVRLTEFSPTTLKGFGWSLITDRETEFIVDLQTGTHTGGPILA